MQQQNKLGNMRSVFVAVFCSAAVSGGLVRRHVTAEGPAAAPAAGPAAPGGPGRFDEGAYAEDWHTEWSHGDFPNYKETYENKDAVSKYEDRQSDGKSSPPYGLLQGSPAPAPAAGPATAVAGPGRYDEGAYAEDWHSEWATGHFPNYKETYENKEAVSQYTDRQSDGKPA